MRKKRGKIKKSVEKCRKVLQILKKVLQKIKKDWKSQGVFEKKDDKFCKKRFKGAEAQGHKVEGRSQEMVQLPKSWLDCC